MSIEVDLGIYHYRYGEPLLLRLLCVGIILLFYVTVDVLIQPLDGGLELLLGEVAVARINHLRFRAIDSTQVNAEKIKLATEGGEFQLILVEELITLK